MIVRALCIVALPLWAPAMSGASVDSPLPPPIAGMRAQPDVGLPSASRVIIGVAITFALAVGAIVLIRRFAPNAATRWGGGSTSSIKLLARTQLSRTLCAQVVEFESTRILIVEAREGVGLTLLPKSETPGRPPSP
ncbi:MAG TPA: hypothetical protein VNZ06_09690 [Steroidobacteraceae bacterium]|jgi:hypothetical protein|nr:hypothetical protein [Steroidobacteraceae bacterium]